MLNFGSHLHPDSGYRLRIRTKFVLAVCALRVLLFTTKQYNCIIQATVDYNAVDLVIVCFLIKLFNTTNMDIVNSCRQYFDVKLPITLWSDRVGRSEKKFAECDNSFCKISVSIR